MPHSVLRRYTPPTCTLELLAKSSPLSRWAGQPVLKQLRFHLRLDDPKLPKEQWVMLEGDRVQLEMLAETVTTYVQRLLAVSHDRLNKQAFNSEPGTLTISPAQVELGLPVTTTNSAGIDLRPKGLMAHELVLGSLATAASGGTVLLSTLQLFDLANALDEYAVDVLALPIPERPAWLKTTSPWMQVAAGALLAVGLSTAVTKIMQPTPTATSSASNQSSSEQKIAAQPSPGSNAPPTASTLKLPPPPPLGAKTPASPGLPTIAIPKNAPANAGRSQAPGVTTVPAPVGDRTVISPSAIQANESRAQQPSKAVARPGDAGLAAASRSAPAAMNQDLASRAAASQPSAGSTAFDTIPQVAEVRQYFQQSWKPPQGLTQTLEYSLVMNADGSIQRIIPLGAVAGDYVDRTGIPLVGEPFVSALPGNKTARIRLVLSPDGTVQTFLERLN